MIFLVKANHQMSTIIGSGANDIHFLGVCFQDIEKCKQHKKNQNFSS